MLPGIFLWQDGSEGNNWIQQERGVVSSHPCWTSNGNHHVLSSPAARQMLEEGSRARATGLAVLEFSSMTSFQDISLGPPFSWEYLDRKTALPTSQAEKKELSSLKKNIMFYFKEKRCTKVLGFALFLCVGFVFCHDSFPTCLWSFITTFTNTDSTGVIALTQRRERDGRQSPLTQRSTAVGSTFWDGNVWLEVGLC